MKSTSSEPISAVGDIPSDVFRRHLHELADWIADYRDNIAKQRISPTGKPGAIRSALPSTPPETAEPLEEIFADVDRVIIPGVVHWAHPQFVGYFGCTTTAPGIFAEMEVFPQERIPYDAYDPAWLKGLKSGQKLAVLVDQLSEPERSLFSAGGVRSALIAPVLVLASGVASVGFYGWLALGVLIFAGSKIIWWATERAWGKFS